MKKPKMEFPVYESVSPSYEQTTSIEDIEDQMDDWLQDSRAKKKVIDQFLISHLSIIDWLLIRW